MTTQVLDPERILDDVQLAEGLASRPLDMPATEHAAIVERVATAYAAAKRDQTSIPAPYQPAGEWASYLAERDSFYRLLEEARVEEALPKLASFWRNELGPIVKEYARFEQLEQGDEERVERFKNGVARNYLIWRDTVGLEASALDVAPVGNPWGLVIDGQLVVPKATRFHTHATMIQRLLTGLGRAVVADIGGGYGGVAYYLLRDAPHVTYVDFDLPETLALASYYLLCSFPDRKALLYGESMTADFGEAFTEFDFVMMPNFEIRKLPERSVDVLLNSFSLSEVPRPTLDAYMGDIGRAVAHYFLHNNMDRVGVVNRGHQRIPASTFPVDPAVFKLVYKAYDLFHGHRGDYKEFLYERIHRAL